MTKRRACWFAVALGLASTVTWMTLSLWSGHRVGRARTSLSRIQRLVAPSVDAVATPTPAIRKQRTASPPDAPPPPPLRDVVDAFPEDVEQVWLAPASTDEETATRAVLAGHGAHVERLRSAVAGASWPRDAAELDLFKLMQLSRLLAARAGIATRSGRLDAAMADLTAIFEIGRRLGRYEPGFAPLIGAILCTEGLRVVEELLPRLDDPVAGLQRLAPDPVKGLALRMLAAKLDAWTNDGASAFALGEPTALDRLKLGLSRPLIDLAASIALDGLEPVVATCRTSYAVGIPALRAHEDSVVDEVSWMPGARHYEPFFRHSGHLSDEAAVVARVRLAHLAAHFLAVDRGQAEGPATPPILDPLTDGPFVVEPKDEGTVLRSAKRPAIRWRLPIRVTVR